MASELLPLTSKQESPPSLLPSALSLSLYSLLLLLVHFITIFFLNQSKQDDLFSTIGLGQLILILLFMAPSFGIQQGLSNSISKDFGALSFEIIGQKYIYAQGFVFIVLLGFIMISFQLETIMVLLGQDQELSARISGLLQGLYLPLALYGSFLVDMGFFIGQGIVDLPVKIEIAAIGVHSILCHHWIKYGIQGYQTILLGTYGFMFLCSKWIIFSNQIGTPIKVSWKLNLINQRDGQRFGLEILPIVLGVLADEATYEITSLVVGLLKDNFALSAHIALINSLQIFVTFNEGFASAINTLVGNALGQNKPYKAQFLGKLGIALGLLFSIMIMSFLFVFQQNWAEYYSSDYMIQQILYKQLYIFSFVALLETFQIYFIAILKSLNKQVHVFLITTLGFSIDYIGSYVFGIKLGYGLQAIWFSQFFGLLFNNLLLFICLYRTNWNVLTYQKAI